MRPCPSYYNNGTTIPTYLGARWHRAAGPATILTITRWDLGRLQLQHPPTGSTFGGESGYNWDCSAPTITSSNGRYTVKITPGPNMATSSSPTTASSSAWPPPAPRLRNLHHLPQPARDERDQRGRQHLRYPGTASSGVQTGLAPGQYATMFFLRGPYNPRDANSNSAAQFCRQCHGGEANEMNGISACCHYRLIHLHEMGRGVTIPLPFFPGVRMTSMKHNFPIFMVSFFWPSRRPAPR